MGETVLIRSCESGSHTLNVQAVLGCPCVLLPVMKYINIIYNRFNKSFQIMSSYDSTFLLLINLVYYALMHGMLKSYLTNIPTLLKLHIATVQMKQRTESYLLLHIHTFLIKTVR